MTNQIQTFFHMSSDLPNVSLGIVDGSLYTRRNALNKDFYKKRMDMLAQIPMKYNFLQILVKTFIIPARQNQFIQEKVFNIAPLRPIAIATDTNSAFNSSYTDNPSWHQQFNIRRERTLRGCQPIVDFDAADNCCLYVTTEKAMNFQSNFPSIPIDNFEDHYLLLFDLTSRQDATENRQYRALVGEPLGLELNFFLALEHVTERIVLRDLMSSVAVNKFGVVEETSWSG